MPSNDPLMIINTDNAKEAVRVDPAGNLIISGNVGIGTSTPNAKLNVDPQGQGGIVIGNPNTGQGGFTSLLLDITAASGGHAQLQSIKSSGTEWGDIELNPFGGNVSIAAHGALNANTISASGPIRANQGVIGTVASGNGIHGITSSNSDSAVYGEHTNAGIGVFGKGGPNGGQGVYGDSKTNYGVFGSGGNAGVAAINPNNNHAAYLASACCGAWFTGDVHVGGTLWKANGGFQIDNPLAPAEKFLNHSFVESPEMKNIYDGIAILDERGEAVVEMPAWFEPLNSDFRYQLTPIGAPGPNLFIEEEIVDNHFKIAGGLPSMKVSWQVTGVRSDAWAKAHPLLVEEEKAPEELGYFLHPELHGASREQSIEFVRHPASMQPS